MPSSLFLAWFTSSNFLISIWSLDVYFIVSIFCSLHHFFKSTGSIFHGEFLALKSACCCQHIWWEDFLFSKVNDEFDICNTHYIRYGVWQSCLNWQLRFQMIWWRWIPVIEVFMLGFCRVKKAQHKEEIINDPCHKCFCFITVGVFGATSECSGSSFGLVWKNHSICYDILLTTERDI